MKNYMATTCSIMWTCFSTTLQGEVIRISGKLIQEILDNGKMNWDKEYLQMVQALLGYLSQGNQLTESENNEFINIIK